MWCLMPRKEKIPKGKAQLTVLISEDIYNLLIDIAPQIYGKHRGALSYVVEEALKQYLYPRKHTHKYTNPKLSVRKVYNQVIEELKEIEGFPFKPSETTEPKLDLAIMRTRGSDIRTIEKWKKVFEKEGLIKFIGGRPPKRIVELL